MEGDNPFGKEASVSATKIFQFLNQVSFHNFPVSRVFVSVFLGRSVCFRATFL